MAVAHEERRVRTLIMTVAREAYFCHPLIVSDVDSEYMKDAMRKSKYPGRLMTEWVPKYMDFFKLGESDALQAALMTSAIPIAILVNAFRVTLTGYLAHRFGGGVADGVIHQTEGFFTFGLAFGLLLLEAWLLSVFWPRHWRRSPGRTRA